MSTALTIVVIKAIKAGTVAVRIGEDGETGEYVVVSTGDLVPDVWRAVVVALWREGVIEAGDQVARGGWVLKVSA